LLGFEQDCDATLAGLASPSLRPDDHVELLLVDQVLRRMPADLRIAWMLRKVEGLPLPEVAHACACSLATVKRRIAAADVEMARHVSFEEGTP
jgi:RNA polymerase sigma-70 factor (ECF subfamily)